MDKKVISCAFNIDTACVEVRFVDGSMISVDCTLVEAEVARNMYESSELEWLVYAPFHRSQDTRNDIGFPVHDLAHVDSQWYGYDHQNSYIQHIL